MKVKELIETCQNQWKPNTLFDYNEDFKIEINTKTYSWKKFRNTDEYLLKIKNQDVAWWEMQQNKLIISTNKYNLEW